MIKLTKLEEPAKLLANASAWTKALLDKISSGIEPTPAERSRYRDRDIKDALVRETNGKCAYCESRIQHIHHGDVEHIYPKSLDVSKTFEWNNLTLSCEICNQNKSNKDPLLNHIIDPYIVDPEDHLFFVGGLIFPKGTIEGVSTRALLELHRVGLVEMRNDQVDRIMSIVSQVMDVSLPIVVRKAIYQDLISKEAGPTAPYSAMSKCVLRQIEHLIDPALLVP